MTAQEPMTLDRALVEFAAADYDLPEDAMRWVRANWKDVGPELIRQLERYIAREERWVEIEKSLLFTTLLMAEKRDVCAHEAICGLASLPDDTVDYAMGEDWITSTLPSVLTATFNGDARHLQRMIESTKVGKYARSAAMHAYQYLTINGDIDRNAARVYLGDLYRTLKPRKTSIVWCAWCDAIAWLGFEEHRDLVKTAFARQYIHPQVMSFHHFEEDLTEGVANDGRIITDTMKHHYAPVDDAIALLSGWYAFSEERKKADREQQVRRLVGPDKSLSPPVPVGKIGRNDPCPCGSGKKYKKCCLH